MFFNFYFLNILILFNVTLDLFAGEKLQLNTIKYEYCYFNIVVGNQEFAKSIVWID